MMRLLVVLTVLVVLMPGVAFGQGWIMVFSDPSATDCNFTDTGGLIDAYVWHMYSPGATASEWMLNVINVGWTHLFDTPDFDLVIGKSVDGVAVGYEACLQGDFRLMTVNFFGSNADPCGLIGIVAAPAKYGVRSKDCAENVHYIPGGEARVNPVPGCWCGTPPSPVESTTWGKVKALYR